MHYRPFFMALLLLSLLMGGCTATYIPISWGMRDKVHQLSRSDLTLSILYERYDPKRETLAFAGSSFNEVMMPSEVKHHLGAYRPDTKLIYRNLFQEFTDQQLRDLMLHELAHHIWYGSMTSQQKYAWGAHLEANPTPLQDMVRRVYHRKPEDHPAEDFAFTLQYAREVDIEKLAKMQLLTDQERDKILNAMLTAKQQEIQRADLAATASGDKLPKAEPPVSDDKPSKAEPSAPAADDKLSKAEPSVPVSGDKLPKAEPSVSAPDDKLPAGEPAVSAPGDKPSPAVTAVSASDDKLSKAETAVGETLSKDEAVTTTD